MVFHHLLHRYPGLVLVTFLATCIFLPSMIRQTNLWHVQTQGDITDSGFNTNLKDSDNKEPDNHTMTIAMATAVAKQLSAKPDKTHKLLENNKKKPIIRANIPKNINKTSYVIKNISPSIAVGNTACVRDMESPVFNFCPAHITTTTNNTCTTINWDMPVASDNCNVSVLDFDYSPNTCFPVGTTSVTYTATDKSGNQSKCQFKVTVENPNVLGVIQSFDSQKDKKGVLLKWSIQPDTEIEYFIVQRTDTLGEFQGIDIIEGTSKVENQEYFYYDSEPLAGNSTYRIKAILAEGNFQYSEVKYVSFKKINNTMLYHKQGDNVLNIDLSEFEGKSVDIRLINQLGQMLENYNISRASSTPEQLDVSGVKPGIYFIHIIPFNDEKITRKLVIR